jgi:glycosyltransferase involved in cell wall biosynthesis
MKIVLLQEERYLPSYHGSNKSNRALLESLARYGHECIALCTVLPTDAPAEPFISYLSKRRIELRSESPGLLSFRYNGVEVRGMPRPADIGVRAAFLTASMTEIKPDIVLVSSSFQSYQLQSAMQVAPHRTVYLAHGHHDLPFGPTAEWPDAARAELLRQVASVVTVSHYGVGYFREHANISAQRLNFPVYDDAPFANLGSFDRGAVTLIRSSVIKGVQIFLELAIRFRSHPFAASTWGASPETLEALRRLPNMTLFQPAEDIADILTRTKVLLVPSVLPETFGLIVPEAMLRGIPVLASDLGGLPEAALGVGRPLSVRPAKFGSGAYICPPQDLSLWEDELGSVLENRAAYESRSRQSRAAAAHFAAQVSARSFEDLFQSIVGRWSRRRRRVLAVVDPYDAGCLLAEELRRRGCSVIGVVSNEYIDPEILAKGNASVLALSLPYRGDIKETSSSLRALGVEEVLAGCETGVNLADALSEKMDLRSNGTLRSQARRNKFLMAERARSAGLGVPDQHYAETLHELLDWVDLGGRWPVVVKPPESLASDGVSLCRSEEELASSFERIVGRQNIAGIVNRGLVVQELVDGPQYVVDTVSMDGSHYLSGIWRYRPPAFASEFLESLVSGTAWPCSVRHLSWQSLAYGAISSVSKEIVTGDGHISESLFAYVSRLLDALEIRHGPAHFELMWTSQGIRLIEVGARVHGAPQSHVVARLCTGISQVEQTVDLYLDPSRFRLGARRSYTLRWHAMMVRLKIWRIGLFRGLLGFDRLKRLDSFHDAFAMAGAGAKVPGCVGVVILLHPDRDVIEEDYQRIRNLEENDLYDFVPEESD